MTWRGQLVIAGFRSGLRGTAGCKQAVTVGTGLGIVVGLVACFVMLIA